MHLNQYDYASTSNRPTVTDLEPLLRIIVACAPLFPPTFKAIHDRTYQTLSSGSSARGFAKVTLKDASGSDAQASGGSYTLTDIRGGLNDTQITSSNSQPSSFRKSNEVDLDEIERRQHGVTVKKGREIRTDKSSHGWNETI